MKNKMAYSNYLTPEFTVILFYEDIVTLSGGNNGDGNLGTDLGDGQVGNEDIFE